MVGEDLLLGQVRFWAKQNLERFGRRWSILRRKREFSLGVGFNGTYW